MITLRDTDSGDVIEENLSLKEAQTFIMKSPIKKILAQTIDANGESDDAYPDKETAQGYIMLVKKLLKKKGIDIDLYVKDYRSD